MDLWWKGVGLRLLTNPAPTLWFILTIYCHHWGFEILYYPEVYWPMMASARMLGIEWRGLHLLVYLGKRHPIIWLDERRSSPYLWISGKTLGREM